MRLVDGERVEDEEPVGFDIEGGFEEGDGCFEEVGGLLDEVNGADDEGGGADGVTDGVVGMLDIAEDFVGAEELCIVKDAIVDDECWDVVGLYDVEEVLEVMNVVGVEAVICGEDGLGDDEDCVVLRLWKEVRAIERDELLGGTEVREYDEF